MLDLHEPDRVSIIGRFQAPGLDAIEVQGDGMRAYVRSEGHQIYCVELADPSAPRLLKVIQAQPWFKYTVDSSQLWLSNSSDGVAHTEGSEISDLEAIQSLGSFTTTGYVRGLILDRDRLFVATSKATSR